MATSSQDFSYIYYGYSHPQFDNLTNEKIIRDKLGNKSARDIEFIWEMILNNELENIIAEEEETVPKEKLRDNIQELLDLLNVSYSENWDILLSYFNGKFYLTIAILYPKLEIKNSSNLSHKISDLLVIIPFNIDINNCKISLPQKSTESILGTRITVTNIEYQSEYFHSHLGKNNNLLYPEYFCLGSSEILDLIIIINNKYFDINLYELFFLSLNEFVRWESIEGVPYIHIENISKRGIFTNISVTHLLANYNEHFIKRKIKKYNFDKKEDIFIINNGYIEFKNDNFIFEMFLEILILEIKRLFSILTHFNLNSAVYIRKDSVINNFTNLLALFSFKNTNSKSFQTDDFLYEIFVNSYTFSKEFNIEYPLNYIYIQNKKLVKKIVITEDTNSEEYILNTIKKYFREYMKVSKKYYDNFNLKILKNANRDFKR